MLQQELHGSAGLAQQLDFGALALDSGQKDEAYTIENSDSGNPCDLPIEKTSRVRTRSKSPIRKSGQSLPPAKQVLKTSKPIKGLLHVASTLEGNTGNSSKAVTNEAESWAIPLCLQHSGHEPILPAPLNQQVDRTHCQPRMLTVPAFCRPHG